MAEIDDRMAELMKSSMQFDIDTRTFLIVAMGGYTAVMLLVWIFTGSHIAMLASAGFAFWNVREVRCVNFLQDRVSNCNFSDAFNFSAQTIVRWAYVMTLHAERRAAAPLTESQP